MMNIGLEQAIFGDDPFSLQNVAALVAAWEVLYQSSKVLFSWVAERMVWEKGSNKTKFVVAGPSYFVGAIHALLVALRSTHAVVTLMNATLEQQILATEGYDDEKFFIQVTNVIVLSYFLYDVVHCLLLYPKLGGVDILGHHLGLIIVCYLCGKGEIFYFTGSWIVAGEWSTPFLSARFILIQAGQGHTKIMRLTETAFAISFFLSRPISYTIGFVNLTANMGQVMELVTSRVSFFSFCFIMGLIYLAWFLQLFWANKILGMALKTSKNNNKKASAKLAPE